MFSLLRRLLESTKFRSGCRLYSGHSYKWRGVGPGDSGEYEDISYLSINVVRIQKVLCVANEMNSSSIVWSSTDFWVVNGITASTVRVITHLPRKIPTLHAKNTIWRNSATSKGFEPSISVIMRLQISASDHTATDTDTKYFTHMYTEILFCKTRNLVVISR